MLSRGEKAKIQMAVNTIRVQLMEISAVLGGASYQGIGARWDDEGPSLNNTIFVTATDIGRDLPEEMSFGTTFLMTHQKAA